jgi:hypothetical protein
MENGNKIQQRNENTTIYVTYMFRGDSGALDKGAVQIRNNKIHASYQKTTDIPGAGDFRSSDPELSLRFFIGFRGAPVRGPYSDLGFLGNSTL